MDHVRFKLKNKLSSTLDSSIIRHYVYMCVCYINKGFVVVVVVASIVSIDIKSDLSV